MSKIVIGNTSSGYNLAAINSNLQNIADVLNNEVLFRNNPPGEPNQMSSILDMNGNPIINLPAPTTDSSPARLKDVTDAIGNQATAVLTAFEPFSPLTATNVQGAITQLSAWTAAGEIGKTLFSVQPTGAMIPNSNVGSVNVTLNPGNWIVFGWATYMAAAGTSITRTITGLSNQSAINDAQPYYSDNALGSGVSGAWQTQFAPPRLMSFTSGTLPAYLNVYAEYSGTVTLAAGIVALRIR